MKKALFTATVLSHIAQFHGSAIGLLRSQGFEVHVAGRDNLAEKNGLSLPETDRVFDLPFERSPWHWRNMRAAQKLRSIVQSTHYDIIHCNTPVAGILTRLVSGRTRSLGTTLIYTAHGFHFYRGAPHANWLAYYPLERAFARLTDVLVTINTEDYQRAKHFPAGRVAYVPGVGVDVDRFDSATVDHTRLRKELGLPLDTFVVLSVGELNDNKNHRTVIKAMARLQASSTAYLICGNGPRRAELEQLVADLGLSARVQLLGYRRDIPDLLRVADVFCLPSFREGLPLAMMEAMAVGKPIVASRIRGSNDLVEPGLGGSLIESADDVDAFAGALSLLSEDPALRSAMGTHNRLRVGAFSNDAVTTALADVYGLSADVKDIPS